MPAIRLSTSAELDGSLEAAVAGLREALEDPGAARLLRHCPPSRTRYVLISGHIAPVRHAGSLRDGERVSQYITTTYRTIYAPMADPEREMPFLRGGTRQPGAKRARAPEGRQS